MGLSFKPAHVHRTVWEMNNLKESLVFAQTAAFTSKERKNAACLRAKRG